MDKEKQGEAKKLCYQKEDKQHQQLLPQLPQPQQQKREKKTKTPQMSRSGTTTPTNDILLAAESRDDIEPCENFALQPQPPQPQQSAVTPSVSIPQTLHLSIRLIEMQNIQPIEWGSIVPHNTELAIAMHNDSFNDNIRVVCHICDKEENRIFSDVRCMMDLAPQESSLLCKFRALMQDGPLRLHFVGATFPVVRDGRVYHTKIFVNVGKDDGSEQKPRG